VPTPTEFYRWFIIDERTDKRRLTTYKMTRAQAADGGVSTSAQVGFVSRSSR
jgi:hypothetical protein